MRFEAIVRKHNNPNSKLGRIVSAKLEKLIGKKVIVNVKEVKE